MSSIPAVITEFEGGLRAWLVKAAQQGGYTYLLAHADDGVIWGRFDSAGLHLAGETFAEVAVELRPETLQQARLFGERGELFLWRGEQGFNHRPRRDEDFAESYDESYRLWGTLHGTPSGGFSLMVDGKEGLRHAVPKEIAKGGRAVLVTRHYIDELDGQVAVVDSRLVRVVEGTEE